MTRTSGPKFALLLASASFATIATLSATRVGIAPATAPTFASDVAPIIYANCTTCHRPGQAAPFSLITYADVRKHGKTIVDVTGRHYMPPWHAARAEGFAEFRDERH